jgi:hypothetical protein
MSITDLSLHAGPVATTDTTCPGIRVGEYQAHPSVAGVDSPEEPTGLGGAAVGAAVLVVALVHPAAIRATAASHMVLRSGRRHPGT